MTLRTIYVTVCSLLFAGIVHIAIILLIPEYGTKDAWTTLSSRTDAWSFRQVKREDREDGFIQADPFFEFGTCRFDLDEAGLLMQAPATERFWSASVFDDNGTIVYSLTSRTTIENRMQLLILNPVQMTGLRQLQPKLVETAIVIEANISRGFVVFRLYSPDATWEAASNEFLSGVRCDRYVPVADDDSLDAAEEEEEDAEAPTN